MHGAVIKEPLGRYDEALVVMHEMSWSWRELCECPADLVDEIIERTAARQHWEREKERIKPKKQGTK